MTRTPLHFRADAAASAIPNISIDSPPNRSTVLALSHDPHLADPPTGGDNTTAQMAFRLIEQHDAQLPVDVLTADHVDQDVLVALLVLLEPEQALANRQLLIELAMAGDFGIYQDRRAARASMALDCLLDPTRTPLAPMLRGLDENETIDAQVAALLPILVELATDNDRYRNLWEVDDAYLTASEEALADGSVEVVEHPADGLSTLTVPDGLTDRLPPPASGLDRRPGRLHPMAVNNRTRGFRRLGIAGRWYHYIDRAESFFRYHGQRVAGRIDLRSVANDLNFLEGARIWAASPPSARIAELTTTRESNLDAETVTSLLVDQLRAAPVAWDPFRTSAEE